MVTEVKLQLKKTIINYNKKPIKKVDNISELKQQYPTLSQVQLLDKCPNVTFGDVLPNLLLQVPSQDPMEKLKLFRWASKIEDKIITAKGELTLDLNQVTELYDYIGKVPTAPITTIAPILIYLEELKEKFKEK